MTIDKKKQIKLLFNDFYFITCSLGIYFNSQGKYKEYSNTYGKITLLREGYVNNLQNFIKEYKHYYWFTPNQLRLHCHISINGIHFVGQYYYYNDNGELLQDIYFTNNKIIVNINKLKKLIFYKPENVNYKDLLPIQLSQYLKSFSHPPKIIQK